MMGVEPCYMVYMLVREAVVTVLKCYVYTNRKYSTINTHTITPLSLVANVQYTFNNNCIVYC